MGKFDGYLICSDIDGTFENGSNHEDFAPNREAVEYFLENGGRFTFTTGRYLFYLHEPRFAKYINAPACIFNGAVVYDYKTEKVLFETRLDVTTKEIHEISEPFLDRMVRFNLCDGLDATYEKYLGFDLPSRVYNGYPYKTVSVFDNEKDTVDYQHYLEGLHALKNCYIARSWDTGVEIIPKNGTKGQAIRFIKEYLGDIHTSIGVGDYENDLPLIRDADVGVAVANATPRLLEIADIVGKDYREFAIKDIIGRIERGEI